MKTRMPLFVFLLCCLSYLGILVGTASLLPDPVATHFGLGGLPDDWMSRRGYLWFIVGMGIGMPSFIASVFYLARLFPNSCWNLQNRDYWLAPERRDETCAYLFGRGLWLGSLTVVFVAGMHLLTIQANRQGPPSLSLLGLFGVLGTFLVLLAAWFIPMWRRFKKVP